MSDGDYYMKRVFQMYQGLKKEVYVLCFGRFVTGMGSLVWPMLTLILKSKLGYDAQQVASWFLLFGILQLPFALIGGKLTDKYNKRNLILIFDLISVFLFVITAFLPLSTGSLCVYFMGSLFQHMEWPAYDALIAEMTTDTDREKAYSLQYLAVNVGVVFAPTLGGLLFQNYLWVAFLLSGVAIFSSTILIFFFIPKKTEIVKNENTYEEEAQGSLTSVLKTRKLMFLYIVISCVITIIYGQFNYLLPMQMDEMFFEKGAVFFGMLTSINGLVVITFTPIFTHLTLKWQDISRVILGAFLECIGLASIFFYSNQLWMYIVSMIVFTMGEVIYTLGNSPYISKRIPASHRGRYTSSSNILTNSASTLGNMVVGKIVVTYSYKAGWIFTFILGMILMIILLCYRRMDKKSFRLLYDTK